LLLLSVVIVTVPGVTGINYYEEDDWIGKLPEGVLSVPADNVALSGRHLPRIPTDPSSQQENRVYSDINS